MMKQENMLARYSVLHELERGAIGAVYAARDRETGTLVALNRLDPALLSQPDANFADRLLQQVRSARLLKHRNIVRIHDAGEVGGTVYVATEMLEGQNLRNILAAGPVRMARAIQIARDIACGLAHAHLEGVVHGALEPSKVIVLRSGEAKITDFGIAQLEQAALLSGARSGCLSYMSPERLRGDPVDHRCDIFSLGALFYELLTHRPPFEGGSPKEIMEKILHAKPPLPSELNPHVPRALDELVFSMLAGEPVVRTPGAPIVLRDLQRLEQELGLRPGAIPDADEPTATRPPARPEPMPRPRGQTEPAASPPPPEPESEPRLRMPDPNRFRDRAPMQDPPRFARHGQAHNGSGFRSRPDSPAAAESQYRSRRPDGEAFDEREAMLMMERESWPERSSGSLPAMFSTLGLVLVVLGGAVAGFMSYSSGHSQRGSAASRMQEAPATAPAPSGPTALAPVAEATREPTAAPGAPQASPPRAMDVGDSKQEALGVLSAPSPMPPRPLAAEPGPLAQTESVVVRDSERPASAGTAQAQEHPGPMKPTAKAPPQQSGGTARLIVAVAPRGEVYIDGKHHGTTPPITTFELEPGMHRIEVRSGSLKPYLTYMTVQSGDVRRIRHDFDASRAAHPPQSASWQKSNRPAR